MAAFAPEATVLDATEGNMAFIRHGRVVDVNHSDLKPLREVERSVQIVGDDAGRETRTEVSFAMRKRLLRILRSLIIDVIGPNDSSE